MTNLEKSGAKWLALPVRMRRAAKQYAHRLGPQLQRAYGASEHYSAGQIRTRVAKLGLNPKFIVLDYAGFLREDDYAQAAADALVHIEYLDGRDLFERFRPANLFLASANPQVSNAVWTPTARPD